MFYVYVLAYIYMYANFLSRVKPVIYRTLSRESRAELWSVLCWISLQQTILNTLRLLIYFLAILSQSKLNAKVMHLLFVPLLLITF